MSEYLNSQKEILTEISSIVKNPELKPLIIKLAHEVAKGLKENRPEALNQAKMATNGGRYSNDLNNPKNVSKIVKMLREKYFTSVSLDWINKCMPAEYKESRTVQEKDLDPDTITDRDLIKVGPELQKRYKDLMNKGPAQDIKIKKSVEGIRNHEFKTEIANMLSEIILNIEKDFAKAEDDNDTKKINELKEIDKQIAKRLKSVADRRFASDEMKYEAILLACSTYDSLNNATKYETEILPRWEVFDRESKCRKCYGDLAGCRAEKCNCACHETVKRLTTKGLKWAKEHNPDLKKLDESIKKWADWSDDICSIGKVILRNPHTGDYMSPSERKKLLYSHIDKDKCEECEFFLDEHPNFFEELK